MLPYCAIRDCGAQTKMLNITRQMTAAHDKVLKVSSGFRHLTQRLPDLQNRDNEYRRLFVKTMVGGDGGKKLKRGTEYSW